MGYNTREAVVQNLKDAGCGTEVITQFIELMEKGEENSQRQILAVHRRALLERLHKIEREIDCLDYLMDQL